ncbi:SWIB complex BAF60b domain-containing family protein [Tripterygium wilfordii]|uniref:SWIB complex BAF60b domain-containing family protein n=1 Tax=Tripterygium wilfordii TaxID=458696 RepID=A0A7J7BV58_TRIWF|nr:upstream activation factor subunit UAF30-like [Tripterygium wilfordii]KAF5725769.1 SWIB complex BAF60b domain-containing family protein [Tripterygium wilfordii]
MSFATSRVFKACRALLAPARSSAAAATASKASSTASKASSTVTGKIKAKPKPKLTTPTSSKPTGILKVTPVSPALGDFLGSPESSRTEAVKKIWAHIKLHNLQNPANKREIFCDQKLKNLFDGKDKVGFLEIGKLLSRHFVKTD